MFEIVRAFRDAFGIDATWSFVLIVALFFATVGGGVAWLVDRAYRNAVAAQGETRSSVIAAAPTDAERAARHALRVTIGDLFQRGRMYQQALLAVADGTLRDYEKKVPNLITSINDWNFEVIRLAKREFGQAEAMRVGSPPALTDYPKGLQQTFDGGRGGFDLRHQWAVLVSGIAALDRFLSERPEF